MQEQNIYVAIDLKSFYASVELGSKIFCAMFLNYF